MIYRRLGRTDIDASAVCLGCWALIGGGTWGDQDRAASRATIRAALDAGINFFDTAPAYGDGESESLLGEELAGLRKDVVIATKVSREDARPKDLRASCIRSLRLLRTDCIDLLQLHWPNPDVPVADTLGQMRRLQEEGKVRALGVSNFGVSYLTELLRHGHVETDQLDYSLLWRAVEHEVLPACVQDEIGVLCYSPLCQGLLTGKFASPDEVPPGRARTRLFSMDRPQCRHNERGCEKEAFQAIAEVRRIAGSVRAPMGQVALAWLLAQKGVTAVIAGARSPRQVRDNAPAAELKLAPAVLEALAAATDQVKRIVGRNVDMWQSDSRLERPAGGAGGAGGA